MVVQSALARCVARARRGVQTGVMAAMLLLIGGVGGTIAQDATNPVVIERMRVMSEIGAATKVLGDMVSGRTAFDETRADQAAASLVQLAGRVPGAFSEPATDPASEALPSIWANWSTFTARASDMRAAAMAVDPSSAGSLRAGLADIGGACRACHTTFRQ